MIPGVVAEPVRLLGEIEHVGEVLLTRHPIGLDVGEIIDPELHRRRLT